MALRKIVEQGDECLTKVCRPVTKFDRRLHILLDAAERSRLPVVIVGGGRWRRRCGVRRSSAD